MTTITAKKVLLKDELGNALIPYTEDKSGLHIGQIISMNCSPNYVPEGTLPTDGAEYTKAQFNDLWDNYFSTIGWNYNHDYFVNEDASPDRFIFENQYVSFVETADLLPIDENIDWSLCFNLSDVTNYYQLCSIYNTGMGDDMYVVIDNGELKVTLFGSLTQITSVSTGDLYVKREDEMLWYSTNGTDWEAVFSIGSGASTIYGSSGNIDLSKSYIGGVQLATPKTLLNTCTYSKYEQDLGTYGQCAKFAVDIDNETFRVPKIKDGAVIQQALTDSELGKAYNAGLPNIKSTFVTDNITSATPPFSTEQISSSTEGHESGGSADYQVTFDLSTANPIYGASDTVQMNAVALRYFVVVANGSINQSMMDWSQWASSLDGKANVDGSNMVASVKNFDGQWVLNEVNFAVDAPTTSTDTEYDLSNYLPDDGYQYEVLFSAYASPTTTKSKYVGVVLKTDVINNWVHVCMGRCQVSGVIGDASGSAILAVGTGRKVIVMGSDASNWGGTYILTGIAYRRVGTNE